MFPSQLSKILGNIFWEWEKYHTDDPEYETLGNCKSKRDMINYFKKINNLEQYFDSYNYLCGTVALTKDNTGVIEQLLRNNLRMDIKEYTS